MTEDEFWGYVAKSGGTDVGLIVALRDCSPEKLIAFDGMLHDKVDALSSGYAAGILHDWTQTWDDQYDYVCAWIVSRGREYYEKVLASPTEGPKDATYEQQNELFMYAADKLYEAMTGKSMFE